MTVSEDTGATGRVVTFYSYKGGTGRTMALANVGWLLASNGYRVLAIDWDLESPGLHRYFHPFLKDKDLRSSEGILDLVRKYADATLRPTSTSQELQDMAQIQEYAASLAWEFPRGGQLDFVPAGRQDIGYVEAASTFDWDSFYTRLHGSRLIDVLRADMTAHYDFVLIDSRTGTSDTAGICTLQLPHTVVNCFTLNTQSIDGAVAIANSVQQRAPHDITVLPLPTRIEDGEKAKLERGRTYSRKRFEPFLGFLGDGDPSAYWNSVEVPYIPFYAYEEILAVFGDTPEQNGRLLSRYVRLASRIAGHDCAAPVIAEADRTRVLRAFEQSAPRDRRTVLVAYAPLDRIWAEWLRDRLGGPAHHVVLHNIAEPVSGLDDVDRLIVMFSRDLVGRDEGLRLLRAVRDRLAAGDHAFAVALRVDSTSVEQRIPPHALIDVMGVHEERAMETLFAALALDPQNLPQPDARAAVIHYPAVTPAHWNLRLTRNPRFSGRGALLDAIRERLQSSGSDGGRLALTGLPGVGKTQTALEYVYRFAAAYEVVWWISAAQPARARVALADLATELQVPGGDVDEQVLAALEALRRGVPERRWLVVFDNADVPADLADLLPTGPGHVLVTSRNPQWSSRMAAFDVTVFQRAESRELIGRRVPGIAEADADRLAVRLGDLPLALEQAGGWLASTGMTVTDYLALLDSSAAQAMDESAPADYSETIASTVRVAYDELARRSPAAARLLELFAFLAPEAIPYRLISNKQLTALLAPIDVRMYDPTRHGSLNREIGRLGLARVDSGAGAGGVVVHRLTQDIVRSRLTDPEQAERRAEIQGVLAEADRGNPDNSENWPVYEALRPHLEPAGALASDLPEIRQLLIDMVRYLWRRGDYTGCRELATGILTEWLDRFGDDDTWVLRLRHPLALALRDQGHESEAYEMNRDTLERLRRTLGDNDVYTLVTAGSYAADLRARGEYFEALELDEQTTKGLKELLGDDDPLSINAVGNLAVSVRLTGEFARAAKLDREALERRRRVQKELAKLSQESYGTDLREVGDLVPSRNQLEEAHEAFLADYGPAHLRSLEAAFAYAVTLRRLGQTARAAKLIDDAARRAAGLLGVRHRVTLNCRLEQATVRWAEGRHEAARDAAEEIYRDYRDLRGYGHPYTLVAGNDLAIFRRWAGDVEGALRLSGKTVDRFEAVLGPRHPYTLAAMVTLANAQYAGGARAAARERDDTVYGRLRKTFRDDHPTVLSAAVNHAISHRAEQPEPAEKLHADALSSLQATLGDSHPLVSAAREWRRIDVDTAPFAI